MTHIIAIMGFGEAGQAFATGLLDAARARGQDLQIRAFDRKTDAAGTEPAQQTWAAYARCGVHGCASRADALAGAEAVLSLVTADQAEAVARAAAPELAPGALFLDGNSVAPATKARAASLVEAAGGAYVDCAIMAPVHPRRHRTPLLLSGPHAARAGGLAQALGMQAQVLDGPVGRASSVKMIRSVMMKGLEALMAEAVLAGRLAGVEDMVLDSLEATYPGFGWQSRAAYMLERMTRHGLRRAAEMEEVAQTLRDLRLPDAMASAAVGWQRRLGGLGLALGEDDPAAQGADAILGALGLAAPGLATPGLAGGGAGVDAAAAAGADADADACADAGPVAGRNGVPGRDGSAAGATQGPGGDPDSSREGMT